MDAVTGNNYEHRKDWIEERLQELCACMALDVCGFAVMANHLHVVRASNKGFLSMSLAEYLQTLDWAGRQVRGDKRGAIPGDVAPIL